jgi:hypothetical protein
MKKIPIVKLKRNGKFTGGWIEVKKETLKTIRNWTKSPNNSYEYDMTERIE